ncbi:MAG TPA: replication protein [Pyrinomonadaceae bacterium]|nr:replication protein [Pyrinomonadaceae bacterium]
MSSERKYTGMAKLFAIEEKQQKEKAAEKAAANISAPEKSAPAAESSSPEIPTARAEFSPPVNTSAAEINAAPEIPPAEPLKTSAAETTAAPVIFSRPEQHTRIPNEIFEDILPTLRTSEQSILLRLYRLTWGFQKDTCHVSMGKLGKACNLSSRQVTTCVQVLEKRRLIRRIHVDLNNKNQHERGVTFQMLLPQAARAKSSPPVNISAAAKTSAGETVSDNKVNTQKENTQTQDVGVRVGSRFTIEECRRYAEHLRSTGQGINNPGGYATTIHRTGEADELIERFLNPAVSIQVDASQCPDCTGSGFYYPNGPVGGVAKCKHEKLTAER